MPSRFVVAIIPPEEICLLLNPIRDQFETGVSAKLAPHISLTFPFWPVNTPEDIIATVGTISKNYQPFEVQYTRADSYAKANGNKVVHLKVGPPEKFSEINQTLNRVLSSFINYDTSFFADKILPTYDAHQTITLDATAEQETRARELLEPVVGKVFPADSFYLLENPDQTPNWSIFQKFPLGF